MVIKLDGLSEKEKKEHLRFAFLYPKSFELIKQEGRVEGAKQEIEKQIISNQKCADDLMKEKKDNMVAGAWATYMGINLALKQRLIELERNPYKESEAYEREKVKDLGGKK